MKIHEYQAKELFKEYGIPTQDGVLVTSKEQEFDFPVPCVVKAQVHSGGRGKAGGVKLCKTAEEAKAAVRSMLGMTLYTKQNPAGKVVSRVLVTGAVAIEREFYLSLTLDAAREAVTVVASAAGGTEIEETAALHPEAIITYPIPYELGLKAYHARELAALLGVKSAFVKSFTSLMQNMYRLFMEKDCSLVEINPLVENADGLIAIDAKVNFDDNALFRHDEISALRDYAEEDEKELEASKFDLNFVSLNGNIGCLVNGAGLAMATMDIIKAYGGEPANFLDVGGSATAERVAAAFRILLADAGVKAIMVNIFGGIMKCDVIAEGIVEAAKSVGLSVPLIVRLDGTNVELGKEILNRSGLSIIAAADMRDAAKKSIAAIGGNI